MAPLALKSVTDYNVLELLGVDIVAIPIKRPVATTGLFYIQEASCHAGFFLICCSLNELFATEQLNAMNTTHFL
ncbi:hypothetical protein HLP44_000716 [Shigella sonnei]|nr:hypothetical protein [Shigella sonnei]